MEPSNESSVPAPPRRSGLALASLILGIIALVPCPGPLAGIPAVICGYKARKQIRESGGCLADRAMAVAGLVMGICSFVLLVGLLMPDICGSHRSARLACKANLIAIQGAKQFWAQEKKRLPFDVVNDADIFGSDKIIAEKPRCPAGGIYTLNAVSNLPSCSVHGDLSRLSGGK